MSADGEISVAVKAEGVDEAAAEVSDGGGEGGGGPTGGGDGGLGTALRGGFVGGLLSQALGPLLDILDPILKVLEAFLAPLAVMLLRLLQPVLRFLLTKALPVWMDITGQLDQMISRWSPLLKTAAVLMSPLLAGVQALEMLGVDTQALIDDIKTKAQSMVNFLRNLPGRIAAALRGIINGITSGVPSVPNRDDVQGFAEGAFDFITGNDGGNTPDQNVVISGGLAPFVEGITRSTDVEWP